MTEDAVNEQPNKEDSEHSASAIFVELMRQAAAKAIPKPAGDEDLLRRRRQPIASPIPMASPAWNRSPKHMRFAGCARGLSCAVHNRAVWLADCSVRFLS